MFVSITRCLLVSVPCSAHFSSTHCVWLCSIHCVHFNSCRHLFLFYLVCYFPIPSSAFISIPSSAFISIPSSTFIPIPSSAFISIPSSAFIPIPSSAFIPIPLVCYFPIPSSAFIPIPSIYLVCFSYSIYLVCFSRLVCFSIPSIYIYIYSVCLLYIPISNIEYSLLFHGLCQSHIVCSFFYISWTIEICQDFHLVVWWSREN